MSFSADSALKQAIDTAHDFFINALSLVKERCPKTSPDAQLAAAVELAKLSGRDMLVATFAGFITSPENLPQRLIELLPDLIDALQRRAK